MHLSAGLDGWARVWSEDARSPLLCPPQPPRVPFGGERRAAAAAAAATAETPSLSSPPLPLLPLPAAAVAARWSPTRPSVYFLLMSDGGLTAHDLRQRAGSAPEAALRVFGGGGGSSSSGVGGRTAGGGGRNAGNAASSSEPRATALAAHGSGSLLAAGLGDGSVELVEVGPALGEAEPSERAAVATVRKERYFIFFVLLLFFFFPFSLF